MNYVTANCPNCNGEIKLDDSKEKGFCLYCGNLLIVCDVLAKPSGIATVESLIARGYMEIENSRERAFDMNKATSFFDEALKIDPGNSQAWQGHFDAYLLHHRKAHLGYSGDHHFKVGIFRIRVRGDSYQRIHIDDMSDNAVSALASAIKVASPSKKPELAKLQEQYVTTPMKQIQRVNDLIDKNLCVRCEGELKKRVFGYGYGKCKSCGQHSDYSVFAYCHEHFGDK